MRGNKNFNNPFNDSWMTKRESLTRKAALTEKEQGIMLKPVCVIHAAC